MVKWWWSMRCGSITGRRTTAKHRSGAEAAAGRRDSSPQTPELSTGNTNPQAPGWSKRTRIGLAGRMRRKLVPAKSSVVTLAVGGAVWRRGTGEARLLHAHMYWLNLRLAAMVEVVVKPVSLLKGSRRVHSKGACSTYGCVSPARSAPAEASSGARGEGDHLVEIVGARDGWQHFLRLRGRKVNL
ncbi:uncharacterized protein LOC119309612 [Triticum dicoccoides]|uniref:uncharacterized protein LOC119309612 n=1 Tax=Triticum dicoccoides TaxID=85692 RepID=UPI001890ABE3|nr:uncharacterized protein LOC119309612 [Triticum dicoccoides]